MSTSTPFAGAALRSRRPHDAHSARNIGEPDQQPYFQPSGPRPLVRQTSVHVHAANITALITSYRPHKNPRITFMLICWGLGIFIAFFATGPATLDATRHATYTALHHQVRVDNLHHVYLFNPHSSSKRPPNAPTCSHAALNLQVEHAKTTGWWMHAQQRAEVKQLQQQADQLRAEAAGELATADALVKQQRHVMGLWSARGIDHARTFFWSVLTVDGLHIMLEHTLHITGSALTAASSLHADSR